MKKLPGRYTKNKLSGWQRGLPILLILIAVNVFAAELFAAEQVTRDAREFFFTQSFGDLPEELAAAKKQKKQGMLLFFLLAVDVLANYRVRFGKAEAA